MSFRIDHVMHAARDGFTTTLNYINHHGRSFNFYVVFKNGAKELQGFEEFTIDDAAPEDRRNLHYFWDCMRDPDTFLFCKELQHCGTAGSFKRTSNWLFGSPTVQSCTLVKEASDRYYSIVFKNGGSVDMDATQTDVAALILFLNRKVGKPIRRVFNLGAVGAAPAWRKS